MDNLTNLHRFQCFWFAKTSRFRFPFKVLLLVRFHCVHPLKWIANIYIHFGTPKRKLHLSENISDLIFPHFLYLLLRHKSRAVAAFDQVFAVDLDMIEVVAFYRVETCDLIGIPVGVLPIRSYDES